MTATSPPLDIVAVLAEPATAAACLAAAASAAAALDPPGRIEALHVRLTPDSLILPTEEVMTPARRAEFEAMLDGRSRALAAAYREWAGGVGAIGATAVWREAVGSSVEAAIAARGRRCDLLVLARPQGPEGAAALHAGIFDSEHLLLLAADGVPSPARLGRHVAIAWKSDPQVERAVAAAMPWIARADRVTLISIAEPGAAAEAAPEALAQAGIAAAYWTAPQGGGGIGAALLGEAQAAGADCLVMGAYRHSRLREMVLGGATQEVLRGAALPVFAMH